MNYDKNFETVMDYVFKSEGGFSDRKNDLGGRTNMGVTQRTYNSWRNKKGLPEKDVKNITKDEAKQLYYEEFWKPSGASQRNDLREGYLLFDTAVNSGPSFAKRLFEKSDSNIYNFLKNRENFYNDLVNKHPEQKEFINGWMNRLKDVENNMNEIVNKGYYRPPYYDDVTPFDKNYTGVLKKIENSDTEQLQKDRNKYQYLLNKKGQDTGFATDINHQFTRQEIGRMTPDEFSANESLIMEQLEKGQILDESLDYTKQFPHGCFYTREDIARMSAKEYEKHEKDILKQMEKQGIPSEKDLPKGEKSGYSKSSSKSPSGGKSSGTSSSGGGSSDGHWVTIKGNHVLIDD